MLLVGRGRLIWEVDKGDVMRGLPWFDPRRSRGRVWGSVSLAASGKIIPQGGVGDFPDVEVRFVMRGFLSLERK